MYAGTVVAIIDDFLGKSIVLEHRLPNNHGPFLTNLRPYGCEGYSARGEYGQ